MPCFIASGDRIFLLIAVVLGEAVFREVLEIDRAKKPQLITKRTTFRVKRKYHIKSIRYGARRFLFTLFRHLPISYSAGRSHTMLVMGFQH